MRSDSLVLLGGEDRSTSIVYNHLSRRFGFRRVIIESPVPRRRILWRRIRRLGLGTVIGQSAFRANVVPILRGQSRRRLQEIAAGFGLDERPIEPKIVTRVRSVNSEEVIALLRKAAPLVVVVNGTRIIQEQVLDAVDAPFINLHAGITPSYRGVHGAYWALAEGRPDACGVTVHLVDSGIDTGEILKQARIHPGPTDNFVTYPVLQLAAGLPLLEEAIDEALAGRVRPIPPPGGESRLRSHPTLWGYLQRRRRDGVR